MNAIDFVMQSFRADVVTYIATYKAVHGKAPSGADLERLIRSSQDMIQEPLVRARLRVGIREVRIDMSTKIPTVSLKMRKDTLLWLKRHLSDGR
jgi:hypothetical protein